MGESDPLIPIRTSQREIVPDSLETAIGMIMKRSIYRNLEACSAAVKWISWVNTWKSPRDDAKLYSRVTVVNWIIEYSALGRYQYVRKSRERTYHMYLKHEKLVTNAALPSLMTSMTQLMSGVRLVKGAATDASASDREIPTSAAFSAAQSFAPSPHISTV